MVSETSRLWHADSSHGGQLSLPKQDLKGGGKEKEAEKVRHGSRWSAGCALFPSPSEEGGGLRGGTARVRWYLADGLNRWSTGYR